MADYPVPPAFYRISTKAIIWRDGGLLLVREHDHWILPGGGLDHNEDPETGLRRELAEELSISGEYTIHSHPETVGFGYGPRKDLGGANIHTCFICYRVEVDGVIEPGVEVKEMAYVKPDQLEETDIAQDERDTIVQIANDYQRHSN